MSNGGLRTAADERTLKKTAGRLSLGRTRGASGTSAVISAALCDNWRPHGASFLGASRQDLCPDCLTLCADVAERLQAGVHPDALTAALSRILSILEKP
jgi:hypothetical protein